MKIRVAVKDLEREDDCSKVEEALRKDPENAYTISGLMVTVFGVKQEDIHNKSFSAWKKGQPALYARIDRCLRNMAKFKKANCRRHGRAMVYWWNPETRRYTHMLRS